MFVIRAGVNDTLVFSSLTYQKKKVPAQLLLLNGQVELQPAERLIQEVTIVAQDERAYQLLAKSRKAMIKTTERKSKAYYALSTQVSAQPVEMLECYYTASLDENRVSELVFKNGRVALAPRNNGYFVSLDISRAFSLLNLLYPTARMPVNPFQLALKPLRKHFTAKFEESYDSLHPVQVVSFRSVDERNGFSGRAHILTTNNLPLKIELEIKDAALHPFKPLFSSAQILGAAMRLTKVYEYRNDSLFTHHIDFDYDLNYADESEQRQITSSGLLYFYDYHQPFLPVLFQNSSESSDYKKISSLSYNEEFWNDNHVLAPSSAIRSHLRYLQANGISLNYKDALKVSAGPEKREYMEINDVLWSADKRLSISGDHIHNDTSASAKSANGTTFLADRYYFNASVYVDANPVGDSLQHFSASVFNIEESYYNLQTDMFTDCVLNIYFDLVEIERRKMEEEIARDPNSWQHIQECYKKAAENIEVVGLKYFREVQRGRNAGKLKTWNKLVETQLGINNIEIFKLSTVIEYGN